MTFANLGVDAFTFTEDAPDGWTVTGISCEGEVPVDFEIDLAAGGLTVNLTEDEVVTCTVTNTFTGAVAGTGSITIMKDWGTETPVATTFTAGESLGGGTFDLSDTTESEVFDGLGDGAYVVTETIAEGWDVTNIVCTGGTNTLWDTDFETGVLSVNLVDDEDLVCTFTNSLETAEEGGSLTINKVWLDSEGVATTGVPTDFTTSDSLADDDDAFTLDEGAASMPFDNLANAGVYTVSEDDLDGWTLSGIDCTGETTSTIDDSVAGAISVTLADDEDVVCTFTNTQDEVTPTGGSFSIVKVWLGADPVPTTFTTSANLNQAGNSFIATTSAPMSFVGLANGGMYVVTETTPAGWTISDITCTGATASTVDDTSAADAVSVTLANDEDVSCTFTNTATAGGVENPITNNPPPSFAPIPGVVSPSAPDTPGAQNPTIPGVVSPSTPGIESPVFNLPPTAQQPGIVSSESPSSNIGGFQQSPLPPSAGNTSTEGSSNTTLVLFAGLSVLLGAIAAATYGVRRR
jgi:hypothetical protein